MGFEQLILSGMDAVLGFQALGDGLRLPMRFFSALGAEVFYLLIMPAILWCHDVRLGSRVGLVLLTSSGLNSALKLAFALPRPFWLESTVSTYSNEVSFGFPSGHAQNAVSVWGRLAAGLKHRLAWIGAGILILMISLSRVYLGMHFPGAVMGGWLLGGLVLLAFLLLEAPIAEWLQQQTHRVRFALPPLASLITLAINTAPMLLAHRSFEREWADRASAGYPVAVQIEPLNPEGFISIAGVLLGFGWGLLLLERWGGYSSRGAAPHLLLRYILGSIVVTTLFFGLDLLLPQGATLPALVSRYFRYAIVGLWISYGAPRLFAKLKLTVKN